MTDINEMVKQGRTLPLSSVAFIEFADKCSLAIQDVLAIPNWSNYMDDTETEIRETTAYNRALEDVYQTITNRLGGME